MNNELYHHGIIGQKWGVQHGPPYPLDGKVSSKVQKAGKKRKDAQYKADKERQAKGDKRVKTEGISHETSKRDQYLKDVQVWSKGYGKGFAVNNLANEMADNEHNGDYNMRNFGYEDVYNGTQHRNNLYDDPNVIQNFANWTNAGRFGKQGYTNNCSKCSSSFIMNLKGYNCIAGKSLDGNLSTATDYWWDGATTYKEYSNNVQSRIDKFGRRGCGTIGIRYKNGGGHAFNFVTDGKGNTRYVNSQTGDVLNSWGEVEKFFGGNIDDTQRIRITNLTTATPNFKHMAEDDVINYSLHTIKKGSGYRASVETKKRMDDIGYGSIYNFSREKDRYVW
ncbi:MAG: hypothetical protein J6Y02_00890 [Pseudobutyrivibrio sp.]|nr:hypothetical protein [Pseudobutyrivibrio sp.]